MSRWCWSCGAEPGQKEIFCEKCQALQPPQTGDAFGYFGLPRSYSVDVGAVEKAYFARQQQVHPDRFATKNSEEKIFSAQHAVEANQAYDILKCPLKRAEHLFKLNGGTLESQEGETLQDPELLMEMMEKQESLAEATSPETIEELLKTGEKDQALCLEVLKAALTNDDHPQALAQIHRLRYLMKFLREAQNKVPLETNQVARKA